MALLSHSEVKYFRITEVQRVTKPMHDEAVSETSAEAYKVSLTEEKK